MIMIRWSASEASLSRNWSIAVIITPGRKRLHRLLSILRSSTIGRDYKLVLVIYRQRHILGNTTMDCYQHEHVWCAALTSDTKHSTIVYHQLVHLAD